MIHNYSKEEMLKTGIYKITCQSNGRFYIGSASGCIGYRVGFKQRLIVHIRKLEQNKHVNLILQNAYNKYGKDDFIFEILEFCESSMCKDIEQKYLDELQPFYPKGFNICKNALTNRIVFGRKKSTHCNRDVSELSAEKRVPVVQKLLDGTFVAEFISVVDASRKTGINRVAIYKNCKGIYKTCNGLYKWEYKNPNELLKTHKYNPKLPIKVTNIETGEINIYPSLTDAHKKMNYALSTIRSYCDKEFLLEGKFKVEKLNDN